MAELSAHELKRQLQQMDPYRFEKLVAALWESQGYETTIRRGSRDRGVDVEATKDSPYDQKLLIQAKRYSSNNKVGSKEVRNYATLYQQDSHADAVIIVTTSTFTSEATRLSTDLNVKTVDVEYLVQQLKRDEAIGRKFGFGPEADSEGSEEETERSESSSGQKTTPRKQVDWSQVGRRTSEYSKQLLGNNDSKSLKLTWESDGDHNTIGVSIKESGLIFKTEKICIRILPKLPEKSLRKFPDLIDTAKKHNSTYAEVDAEDGGELALILTKLLKEIGVESENSLNFYLENSVTFTI